MLRYETDTKKWVHYDGQWLEVGGGNPLTGSTARVGHAIGDIGTDKTAQDLVDTYDSLVALLTAMLRIRVLPVTIDRTTFGSTFSVTFSKVRTEDVRDQTATTVFWKGTGLWTQTRTIEINQTDRGSYNNGFYSANGVITLLNGDNDHVWGGARHTATHQWPKPTEAPQALLTLQCHTGASYRATSPLAPDPFHVPGPLPRP